jgi:DNA-directed RNA polymerase subunit RPC12/RpoP
MIEYNINYEVTDCDICGEHAIYTCVICDKIWEEYITPDPDESLTCKHCSTSYLIKSIKIRWFYPNIITAEIIKE